MSIVDATEADAVEVHLNNVENEHGAIDISFNLVGVQDNQGTPLTKMSLNAYLQPISVGTRAHFITATESARRMERKGAGVILALTATPSRLALPLVGSFGT